MRAEDVGIQHRPFASTKVRARGLTFVEQVGQHARRLHDDARTPLERVRRDLAHGLACRMFKVEEIRQQTHYLQRAQEFPAHTEVRRPVSLLVERVLPIAGERRQVEDEPEDLLQHVFVSHVRQMLHNHVDHSRRLAYLLLHRR